MEQPINITIHGIGDSADETYAQGWHVAEILGVEPMYVMPFYYEDVMDQSKVGWAIKTAATIAAKIISARYPMVPERLTEAGIGKPADYLADIFVFFLSGKARDAIEERLDIVLGAFGGRPVRVFAHSLGSIIAYWYFNKHHSHVRHVELITMGSPLGSRLLHRLVKLRLRSLLRKPLARPSVNTWRNIYSVIDPLSGFIKGLYCYKDDQLRIDWKSGVRHSEVADYIRAYRAGFLDLPSEDGNELPVTG